MKGSVTQKTDAILIGVLIVLILAGGFLAFKYYSLTKEFAAVKKESAEKILTLEENLRVSLEERDNLHLALDAEKERVDSVAEQFEEVSDTVGTLKKLSEIDKELLQKYSKIYFLNEHYLPKELTEIDSLYVFTKENQELIHDSVWPYLRQMLKDANNNGTPLQIISAYRSFGEQATLKSGYTVVYGSGANTFSADQGYSEHQLGTAVDFTTPALGANFTLIEGSPAYIWLTQNAYKYGFILSYPRGNTYYQFEPWHWRFIGTDLARKLHRENKNFYDVDQREIDAFLINIFD